MDWNNQPRNSDHPTEQQGKEKEAPKARKNKGGRTIFTNKRNAINMSNTKTARHAPVQGPKLPYRQLSVNRVSVESCRIKTERDFQARQKERG